MISIGTKKLLGISMLRGIGPATMRTVIKVSGYATKDVEQLASDVPALQKALVDSDALDIAQLKAEEQMNKAKKLDARILSPLDEEYPLLLADSRDDPFLLYVRGSLTSTPEKSIAIIGTREPTRHGSLIAKRITQFFVEQGWSVVSGLALGCDAISHQTALDAKGHTVAVLAHGLHTVAPTRHQKLADDILRSGGALVTQYATGCDAIPRQFAQRDKTQAGLSQGVVMIQSGLKGGSLIASKASLSYGRWLAVPFPTDEDLAGNDSKIQANLVLTVGSLEDRMNLLKLKNDEALSRVITLRGKDDYIKCVSVSMPNESHKAPTQGTLI